MRHENVTPQYEKSIFEKSKFIYLVVCIFNPFIAFMLSFFVVQSLSIYTKLFFGVSVILWPFIITLLSKSFYSCFFANKSILWENDIEFNKWYKATAKNIFGLSKGYSLCLFAVLCIVMYLSVGYLSHYVSMPANSFNGNLACKISFLYITIIGCFAGKLCIAAFVELWKLGNKIPKINLYIYANNEFIKIKNWYMNFGYLTTIIFVLMSIGVYFGPYSKSTIMPPLLISLLIFIALIPSMCFYTAFILTNKLTNNVKYSQSEKLYNEFNEVFNNKTDDTSIKKFDTYLKYKNEISNYQLSKNNILIIISVFISISTLVIQIINLLK